MSFDLHTATSEMAAQTAALLPILRNDLCDVLGENPNVWHVGAGSTANRPIVTQRDG